MNIDVTKLAAPIAFKTGDGNAIAKLNGDRLVQSGTFSSKNIFRWMRLSSTRAANNQVRTAFLRSLGEAFGIEGATVGSDGRTRFSKEFMDRLEEIFGADFKRDDFGIDKNGVVTSGKPLTERRISAIVTRALVVGKTPFDIAAYRAKVAEMGRMGRTAGLSDENLGKLGRQIYRMNRALDFLEAGGVDAFLEENLYYVDEEEDHGNYYVINTTEQDRDVPYFLKKGDERIPLRSRTQLGMAIFEKYSDTSRGGVLLHVENLKVTLKNRAFEGSDEHVSFLDAVRSYVNDALQAYIKLATDMFFDTIGTPLFHTLVEKTFSCTACIEGQTSELILFQANHGLVESADGSGTVNLAVADHDEKTDLLECLAREAQTLENAKPDKDKDLGWDDYRPVFVENLVGRVRPVQIEANGPVETREVTEADIDALRDRLNAVLCFE